MSKQDNIAVMYCNVSPGDKVNDVTLESMTRMLWHGAIWKDEGDFIFTWSADVR